MTLPEIAVHDHRADGMLGYIRKSADRAETVMDTVLSGLGFLGRIGRPLLPLADRIADRRLTLMMDPYQTEIRNVRRAVGRAGPLAFSLSYEFGCTARGFDAAEKDAAPTLFRTLDWPFHGLGSLAEIVILPGDAGDWITVTWPGVVGCLQGAAPGRFAAALNQAPERARGGRMRSWIASKRRFMAQTSIPPAHLLRQVFETAPDYAAAREMLSLTPVAAPVIFTLTGTRPGEACTIERTETSWATTDQPAAANHFATELSGLAKWRARGHDSSGRREAILQAPSAPLPDGLTPPILNPLTRLAMSASAAGEIVVAGYEGEVQVTAATAASIPGKILVADPA